eukprot:gene25261-biopygen20959
MFQLHGRGIGTELYGVVRHRAESYGIVRSRTESYGIVRKDMAEQTDNVCYQKFKLRCIGRKRTERACPAPMSNSKQQGLHSTARNNTIHVQTCGMGRERSESCGTIYEIVRARLERSRSRVDACRIVIKCPD